MCWLPSLSSFDSRYIILISSPIHPFISILHPWVSAWWNLVSVKPNSGTSLDHRKTHSTASWLPFKGYIYPCLEIPLSKVTISQLFSFLSTLDVYPCSLHCWPCLIDIEEHKLKEPSLRQPVLRLSASFSRFSASLLQSKITQLPLSPSQLGTGPCFY